MRCRFGPTRAGRHPRGRQNASALAGCSRCIDKAPATPERRLTKSCLALIRRRRIRALRTRSNTPALLAQRQPGRCHSGVDACHTGNAFDCSVDRHSRGDGGLDRLTDRRRAADDDNTIWAILVQQHRSSRRKLMRSGERDRSARCARCERRSDTDIGRAPAIRDHQGDTASSTGLAEDTASSRSSRQRAIPTRHAIGRRVYSGRSDGGLDRLTDRSCAADNDNTTRAVLVQ